MISSGLIFASARKFVIKNQTQLLTGASLFGLVATTVAAVQATPKAIEIIQAQTNLNNEKPTPIEIVQATWQCYIPTVIMGGLTAASIIFNHSINVKRVAALASAYTITEDRLRNYKKRIMARHGRKEIQAVDDEIAGEKMQETPLVDIVNTGTGDTLCYDAYSGRYFNGDIELIKRALNNLGRVLLSEDWVSLNSVYSDIGLPTTKLGEMVGFHIDDGQIEPRFSSHLTKEDKPCVVLDFYIEPKYMPL